MSRKENVYVQQELLSIKLLHFIWKIILIIFYGVFFPKTSFFISRNKDLLAVFSYFKETSIFQNTLNFLVNQYTLRVFLFSTPIPLVVTYHLRRFYKTKNKALFYKWNIKRWYFILRPTILTYLWSWCTNLSVILFLNRTELNLAH